MSVIEIQHLTKSYGKARGVVDLSFSVEKGEVFGFIGPNGAGKSTTIRTLLGLIHPTSGSATLFGKSASKNPEVLRSVGYLPSEVFYDEGMKVIDRLKYSASFYRKDCTARIQQLAETLDLDLKRKIDDLSFGNRKKVGIVQGLLHEPELIILDEPTAGLDPLGCREVKDLIRALAQRGKTVILSSHLLSDVEDVCDRAVIYYGGRIQAQGPLHQLLAKPDSVRITAPVLSRETTEKVLNLIRAEVGDTVRLENPTQNLESYFLGVVEAARRQAETSGATSGNRVAEYLRAPGDSGTHSGTHQAESVLDRLSRPTESAAPIVSEIAAPAQPSTEAVLESLVRHEAPAPQTPASRASTGSAPATSTASPVLPAKTAAPEPAKPVDLSKANDALSGLLGGNKGDKK